MGIKVLEIKMQMCIQMRMMNLFGMKNRKTREVKIVKDNMIVFKTVSKTAFGVVVWIARVKGATELEIVGSSRGIAIGITPPEIERGTFSLKLFRNLMKMFSYEVLWRMMMLIEIRIIA